MAERSISRSDYLAAVQRAVTEEIRAGLPTDPDPDARVLTEQLLQIASSRPVGALIMLPEPDPEAGQ